MENERGFVVTGPLSPDFPTHQQPLDARAHHQRVGFSAFARLLVPCGRNVISTRDRLPATTGSARGQSEGEADAPPSPLENH
jgi:hypothetical protein